MRLLILFLTVIGLSSCHTFDTKGYRVTTQHTPLLQEAGQFRVHTGIGFNHVEMMGAVSPIKYVGVVGSTYTNSKGFSKEWGFGGYYPWKSHFVTEAYFIMGESNYRDYRDKTYSASWSGSEAKTRYVDDLEFSYKKKALQLNVGYVTKQFKMSIGTNWTIANYDFFKYQAVVWDKESYGHAFYTLTSDTTYAFGNKRLDIFSIAPSVSFCFKEFMIQTQLSLSTFVGARPPVPFQSDFIRSAMFSTSFGWHFIPSEHKARQAKKKV